MRKRIYIYAYTAMNLGDDLFVKILCNRYPNALFFIMSSRKVSIAFNEISNLKRIPDFTRINKLSSKFKVSASDIIQRLLSLHCDAVVNIGGSLFIQKGKWQKKITSFKKRIIQSRPYFILGSNFGPFSSNIFLEEYKTIFYSLYDICFRDLLSYNLFSNLPNVRYAPDIVFSYPALHGTSKNQVIISVIDLSARSALKEYENVYINKMVEFTSLFLASGYEVYLMGFCEKEGDKKAVNKIAEKLDTAVVKQYVYSGNITEALGLIQKSKYVIATRFHAMILGWVSGKRVLPIIYSDKITNVIQDVAFDEQYITIEGIDKVNVNEAIARLQNSKPFSVVEQCRFAETQFKILDKLLI